MAPVLSAALWGAVSLFLLRIVDTSLGTLRMMMVLRGRKLLAWILAFAGSLTFVVGVRQALADLSDIPRLVGYAAGYSTGMLLGMWIEERVAIGHTHFQIISPRRGSILMEQLRGAGYAVTVVPASGKDGMVHLLLCSVPRRRAEGVEKLVMELDAEAFIVAQDLRPVQHGYWRA